MLLVQDRKFSPTYHAEVVGMLLLLFFVFLGRDPHLLSKLCIPKITQIEKLHQTKANLDSRLIYDSYLKILIKSAPHIISMTLNWPH